METLTDTRAADLRGVRVGGAYVIESELGAGGMGSVWKAKNARTGRSAAVKVILADQLQKPEIVARFEREARVFIEHDNVVQVLDAGQLDDGRLFIVLEYLEGRDLDAYCKGHGKLTAEDALLFLGQIGAGLEALHNAGFVHRDIKPSNVFVTRGDALRAKLIDFGLAKMEGADRADAAHMPAITRLGMAAGTPEYMAPEQFTDFANVDARADIYSLGVVALKMITGCVPYSTNQISDHLPMRLHQPFLPRLILEREAREVPVGCYDAIVRALEYSVSARWQRVRDFVFAFADAIPDGRRRLYAVAQQFERHAAPTDETTKHAGGALPTRVLVGVPPPAAPPLASAVGPSSAAGERPASSLPPAQASRNLILGLLATTAMAAVVTVGVVAHGAHDDGSPPALSVSVPGAPSSSSPPSTTLRSPAPPTLREMRVTTTPSGALISIDGANVGPSPITAAFPDGARVVIRAHLDGYGTNEREIVISPALGEVAIGLVRAPVATPTTMQSSSAPTPPAIAPMKPRPATSLRSTRSGDNAIPTRITRGSRSAFDPDHPVGPQ